MASLKSLKLYEIVLLVLFILYIIFPIGTPGAIAPILDSPIGILILFIITVALFFYTNPILGIVYIFVAFEVVRRSSRVVGVSSQVNYAINQQYVPTQAKKDEQLAAYNPPPIMQKTLEEDVVGSMAPVPQPGVNGPNEYTFKPVNDRVVGASLV
jgi:hypothetical protein